MMSGDLEVSQIELIVEENLQPIVQSLNQRTIVRTGSLFTSLSVVGILNPPMIVSSEYKAYSILPVIFTFSMSMNLVIGILLPLMGFFATPRFPIIISIDTTLAKVSSVLLKVALGFGTSLVLMTASSSWLIPYTLFLFLQFV